MKFKWGDKVVYETNKQQTKNVYVNDKSKKENKQYNFWLGKFTPIPTCGVCKEPILHILIISPRHGHCKICGTVFHRGCGRETLEGDICNNCKSKNKTNK